MLCLGFKIGYKRHTMSLLYTSKEFDQKTCKSYKISGFRIFCVFRKPQNSNSGGHKTSIFIDRVPFTLHPWIRIIYTNTNSKEQKKSHCKLPEKSFEISFVSSGMEKK